MIGATGVGKTEIARRLASIADAPFTKVEASKFTEVGYVGRDVESMVRDLVEQSVNMVKRAEKRRSKSAGCPGRRRYYSGCLNSAGQPAGQSHQLTLDIPDK